MLDDDERQSIREWFRGLVKARGDRSRSRGGGEDARLTGDLSLPSDLASDVKGGGQGGAPPPRDEPDG